MMVKWNWQKSRIILPRKNERLVVRKIIFDAIHMRLIMFTFYNII